MIMNELEQVELTIEAAKENISLMQSLKRLVKNKDFQKIIDTGYLEVEAVRLVHLKADFNMLGDEQQAFVIRGIDAIGSLRSYFSKVMQQGVGAESALTEHEGTREALLADELTETRVQ